MQSDFFVAYAAGFFDGEGSVDIRWRVSNAPNGKQYERFDLRIHVVQIATQPLEQMRAKWGGTIAKRKSSNCSDWVITGSAAAKFLTDVRPYLLVKADEADIAIAFAGTMRDGVVNTIGSKGVDRLCDDVREFRRKCHSDIRAVRVNKGVRPKMNAVAAPAARLAHH